MTVPERSLSPSPVTHPVSPEGPPPPYSANLPPAPPNESQLRALLKKIRTSSKRTETVLNSSILALKKSVEKGMKEDQRSRTRMVGLEEAIRKASEGAEAMRTREMELCKASLDDLVRLESESREELEKRKEGIKIVRSVVLPVEEPVHEEAPDEEEAGPEDGDGLVELARELDALNKAIEIIDREKKKVAKENLRALEVDLGHIEGELIQCVAIFASATTSRLTLRLTDWSWRNRITTHTADSPSTAIISSTISQHRLRRRRLEQDSNGEEGGSSVEATRLRNSPPTLFPLSLRLSRRMSTGTRTETQTE